MKNFKNTCLIVLICLFCWFSIDFILTSIGLGPWKLNTFVTGIQHDVYHHDLKPNLNEKARFANSFYQLCTNEYGFKISCQERGKPVSKAYDIAFIGDSFTEAVGVDYEDSFVGMFAAQNPHLSVVNLGCISYAPTIYFKKIEYLLEKGFTFKHVVVAIDIGDIQDEAKLYTLSEDGSKVVDRASLAQPQNMTPAAVISAASQSDKQSVQKKSEKKVEQDVRTKEQFFTQKYFEYTWYLNLVIDAMLRPEIGLKKFDVFPFRAGWTHMEDLQGTYGPDGVEGGKRQAVESMAKLKSLLGSHNIKMSVMVYPWPAQLMNAPRNHAGVTLWENFCKDVNCESFINSNTVFYDAVAATSLEQVINEHYIRGDFHFNKKGNALLYEELQKALQ